MTAQSSLYEWNEAKRRSNRAKHGVDFSAMNAFVWSTALVAPDTGADRLHDEARFIAVGFIGDVLHAVVFTEPDDGRTRIVSLRKASRKEVEHYAEEQATHRLADR